MLELTGLNGLQVLIVMGNIDSIEQMKTCTKITTVSGNVIKVKELTSDIYNELPEQLQ